MIPVSYTTPGSLVCLEGRGGAAERLTLSIPPEATGEKYCKGFLDFCPESLAELPVLPDGWAVAGKLLLLTCTLI